MSMFKLISVGIVAEDKRPLTSKNKINHIVKVFATELQPESLLAGKTILKEQTDIEDSKGNKTSINVTKNDVFSARWLGLGSTNRITSPDVKKNEKVLIYQYADTDDYYWETIGNEIYNRGKERVIYLFSNNDDINTPADLTNSYYGKISTLDKRLEIVTNANDGELTNYSISLDTKKGIFEFIDGKNNFIKINSALGDLDINMNNNINVTAKNVNFTIGNAITFLSKTLTLTIKAWVSLVTKAFRGKKG